MGFLLISHGCDTFRREGSQRRRSPIIGCLTRDTSVGGTKGKKTDAMVKERSRYRFLSMGYSISEVASAVDLSEEEVTTEVVNSQTHTGQDDRTE